MSSKREDVAHAFTERGQLASPRRDPVIQVGTESATFDCIQEGTVSGTNKPKFGVSPRVASDSLVHSLLDNAEELSLKRERQFTYFIQEQRSAVRLRECPVARSDSTSKRSSLMPEELTSGQGWDDGRAIENHEWSFVRPPIEPVNQPGN
jgi:hypothetical protein